MMMSYMTATLREFRSGIAATLLAATLCFACPLRAAAADADAPLPDARLDGYSTQVAINAGGTGGTITFFIILAAITAGVMFMNAKRSHLD